MQVLQFAIFLKITIIKIIKHLFRSFSSYSCVLVHGLFYENKIPNPPCIKIACSYRGVCACFENGAQLLYNGISSEWFASKPAS